MWVGAYRIQPSNMEVGMTLDDLRNDDNWISVIELDRKLVNGEMDGAENSRILKGMNYKKEKNGVERYIITELDSVNYMHPDHKTMWESTDGIHFSQIDPSNAEIGEYGNSCIAIDSNQIYVIPTKDNPNGVWNVSSDRCVYNCRTGTMVGTPGFVYFDEEANKWKYCDGGRDCGFLSFGSWGIPACTDSNNPITVEEGEGDDKELVSYSLAMDHI